MLHTLFRDLCCCCKLGEWQHCFSNQGKNKEPRLENWSFSLLSSHTLWDSTEATWPHLQLYHVYSNTAPCMCLGMFIMWIKYLIWKEIPSIAKTRSNGVAPAGVKSQWLGPCVNWINSSAGLLVTVAKILAALLNIWSWGDPLLVEKFIKSPSPLLQALELHKAVQPAVCRLQTYWLDSS